MAEKYRRIFKKEAGKIRDFKIWVPHKLWRETLRGLKLDPYERCILISFAVWGALRPSTAQLARELNITWRTAKKAREKLKKLGFCR